MALADLERLAQRDIEPDCAGRIKDIPARITEYTLRVGLENRRIEYCRMRSAREEYERRQSPVTLARSSDRNSDSEPFAIYLFSLSTGERQRLNAPPPNIAGDLQAAFSPDARNVALVLYTTGAEADVYVMPIAGQAGG